MDIKTSVRLVSDGGFVFFVENISIRKQAVNGSAKMQTMRFDVKSLTWKIMKSPLARRLMTPSTKSLRGVKEALQRINLSTVKVPKLSQPKLSQIVLVLPRICKYRFFYFKTENGRTHARFTKTTSKNPDFKPFKIF